MASCENCNTAIPADKISVATRGTEKLLVGPCCTNAEGIAPKVEYHFEISSQNGVVASMSYAGLRVEYAKPAIEIENMISKKEDEQHVAH